VVMVGPDGVGKSSLADALLERSLVRAGYFHFRPPLRGSLPTRVPTDFARPKHQSPTWPPVGWIRLGLAFARFWMGYLRVVRPMVRDGGLVVGDRWAYGYLVQPAALRFGGPPWLARLMVGWLPSPDLVVNLVAPAAEIHRRKQELTEEEIFDELRAWASLPAPRILTVDALRSPRDMAAEILSELAQ